MGNAKVSVVIAGGGTAGHIEPAMAVADAIKQADPTVRITALGTQRGLEVTLVPERGYDIAFIPPVPLPRKVNAEFFRLPFRVFQSVWCTRKILDQVSADVVVGFGGYVSLPAYLAASRLLFPWKRPARIVIHEANARSGLANKVGACFAHRLLAAVPNSGLERFSWKSVEHVGIPVRSEIAYLDRQLHRIAARQHFGLPKDGPVLLVFGGSQGAYSLNEAVAGALEQLLDAGISVLHAYGQKNTVKVSQRQHANGAVYVALPYITTMDLAYAAADLAVTRSGAMTCAEIVAARLPAIYVPLPHGNGEQEFNARPVVAVGGGILISDAEFAAEYLVEQVIPLLLHKQKITEMNMILKEYGSADAAGHIA